MVLRTEARDGLVEHLERAYDEAFGRRPEVEFYSGSGGPREVFG